jgi:hypothetical protein
VYESPFHVPVAVGEANNPNVDPSGIADEAENCVTVVRPDLFVAVTVKSPGVMEPAVSTIA